MKKTCFVLWRFGVRVSKRSWEVDWEVEWRVCFTLYSFIHEERSIFFWRFCGLLGLWVYRFVGFCVCGFVVLCVCGWVCRVVARVRSFLRGTLARSLLWLCGFVGVSTQKPRNPRKVSRETATRKTSSTNQDPQTDKPTNRQTHQHTKPTNAHTQKATNP